MKPRTLARVSFTLALTLTMVGEAGAVFPTQAQTCRKGIAAFSRKFVQKMMRTIQKCDDRFRQIGGIGRRAALVVHHAQGLTLPRVP